MYEISKINKSEWEELLLKSKFSTFFHTWQFRDIIQKTFPWVNPIYIKYRNKENFAICGFFEFKKMFVSIPFFEYGAISSLSDTFKVRFFLKDLENYFGFSKIRVKLHPYNSRLMNTNNIQNFIHNTDFSTFLIEDLQSKNENEILMSLRPSTRRKIRRTYKRENVTVKDINSEKELKDFYKVYLMAMRRHMAPAFPYIYFLELYHNSPETTMRIAITRKNIVAGVIFHKWKDLFQGSMGANHPNYGGGAGYLLLWEMILIAKKEGFKIIDLGATASGGPLEVYKRGWTKVQFPIDIYEKNCSEINSTRNSFLRKYWGKMPISLIQKMSTSVYKRIYG